MKARCLIGWLLVNLCCPLLFGQQMISTAFAGPAITTQPASYPAPVVVPPAIASIRVSSPASANLMLAAALPPEESFYQAVQPRMTPAVCMQTVSLAQGEPQIVYAFDHLQFSRAALKAAFTHDNIVKMAHNFIPGQPFPNAPSYVALTTHQKFDLFVHRSHSFDTISGAFMDSITSQITGAYPSFGGGMAGYGKRLGASVAGAESASFFGTFALPALLHQDPRYFRMQQGDISNRLAYAASRVLIGRSDSGRSVVNTSLILSEFVQAALSNAYIPYRRESVPGTVENALAGLGSVAQARILNEFWPDIMSFVSKHEPKAVHHWQDQWDNSSLGQFAKN